MRFWRPRSLTDLMFIGFALVAVPLLFAVINSATQVRKLADESQSLVRVGVESAHYSQQIFQHINTMKRNTLLLQVDNETIYMDNYAAARKEFHQILDNVARSIGSTNAVNAQISLLRTTEETLYTQLGSLQTPDAAPSDDLNQTIETLEDATRILSEQTNQQIDAGLSDLQAATDKTQQFLMWQAGGVILVTALLVAMFSFLIMRPIHQIDDAINQLGRGAVSKSIAVRGPTDLRKLGEQLEWLRTRLLEIAQERNRFLRHMSHELKTPLAGVREGTELLLDGAVGELTSGQREVGEILRDNSIRLQQLIENLLSFSAWQTRHSGLEITQFRLRPLIKSALETHQLTLLAQRMHLELKVDDIELQADRAKMKLILDNLLSNALKYSPRGGTIYINAKAEDQQLLLDVADTGPGIPAAERTAVFEAFFSGRAPISGHLKGTGIGLSVVSEFVQAHGGSITILDGQYPGAHFRLTLPLQSAQATTA